jgi:hypothetical protein
MLISVRGWVDPRAIVRLEGLGRLKNPTSLGTEPATFRLLPQCLRKLNYRAALCIYIYIYILFSIVFPPYDGKVVCNNKDIKAVLVKVVPLLNYLSTMSRRRMGGGCIEPHFLDLGSSWRWVVSFTPLPLHSRGKFPLYPLDRRLSEPQSRSGPEYHSIFFQGLVLKGG